MLDLYDIYLEIWIVIYCRAEYLKLKYFTWMLRVPITYTEQSYVHGKIKIVYNLYIMDQASENG